MDIRLEHISKRFGNTTIAKDLSLDISAGERWHISGSNGRGKSTLMQLIAGYITPDRGTVRYTDSSGRQLKVEEVFRHLTLSTPYTDLIGDFTLKEQVGFHFRFKELLYDQATWKEWLTRSGLDAVENRSVSKFSSGMKQRLKLLLTLCSKADLVLLDEPCSNLDAAGRRFYRELVEFRLQTPSTWIVCSNNIEDEHFFCEQTLDLDELITS